jgi:hypothetical protein
MNIIYRFCTTLLFTLLTISTHATDADSLFVVKALAEAPAKAGTLYFARLFIGRPYVAHTLEVNDTEQLVVNTRELDCTTLVENVLALTLCHLQGKHSFEAFRLQLTRLRYRQGIIDGYPSRLHYFTDWILDNEAMHVVSEIQQTVAPFTAIQTISVDYMSRHPQSYRALGLHPEFISQIADQERSLFGRRFRYIPKSQVADTKALRQCVHNGDVLAITCSKPGLDIAHLGFAVWRSDGLHLLNASQLHKKVVEEPMTLNQYLSKHPTHTGIRVIRLRRDL